MPVNETRRYRHKKKKDRYVRVKYRQRETFPLCWNNSTLYLGSWANECKIIHKSERLCETMNTSATEMD